MRREPRFIVFLAFVSGCTTLACELTASRLLAPAFGTSVLVWSAIIGLMLIYLAVGYVLGGRLADRRPEPLVLYRITAVGAFSIGLVPFVAQPILAWGSGGLASGSAGVFLGAFLSLIALFAVPITLLGMVSPFAIRLITRDVASSGRAAGKVYAVSTLGSFLGAIVPVVWITPAVGTRDTFLIFAALLLGVSLYGLLRTSRASALRHSALVAALLVTALASRGEPVKAAPGAIFETESPYNFIQVVQRGEARLLKLNEGLTIDAVHRPDARLTGLYFDRLLLAPLFVDGGLTPEGSRIAVIGGATGTVAKLLTRFYGPVPIDLVEIDPEILRVGRRFFALDEPNVAPHAADGRVFLTQNEGPWDVIVHDAYRVPYIPFHLATREFFALAASRLTDRGVLVVNVLGAPGDARLVDAVGGTLRAVFPTVFALDAAAFADPRVRRGGNTLLFATKTPAALDRFRANALILEARELIWLAGRAAEHLVPYRRDGPVMTDDHAPIEQILHEMLMSGAR